MDVLAARERADAIRLFLDNYRPHADPMAMSLEERRAGMAALATANPAASDLSINTSTLGGVAGTMVRAPDTSATSLLLHLHGGAYVAGASSYYAGLLGEISRYSGRTVFSLDYRLAPEHPFPAAIEDSTAAFAEATTSYSDVAVLGDSAGGGLALAMLMSARDAKLPTATRIALFSPWTDLTGHGDSLISKAADDPIVDPRLIANMAALYLAGTNAADPLASPFMGDFTNFPPMLIQVGSCEVLLDDALAVDRAARKAGVKVTLEVWPEMFHVWHIFMNALPQARDAAYRAGRWLAT